MNPKFETLMPDTKFCTFNNYALLSKLPIVSFQYVEHNLYFWTMFEEWGNMKKLRKRERES